MALPTLEFTSAGFEKQIGVNHFGHAYLVMLLEKHLLAQTFPSRIVVLSSIAHQQGSIDLNDIHYTKGRAYSDWGAYGQSKLANLMHAKGLALKYESNPLIKTCSVHPGVIQTNLWNNNNGWTSTLIKSFMTDKTIPQGASTTLFGCLSPELNSGAYLKDCAEAVPSAIAQDPNKTLSKAFLESTEAQLLAAATSNRGV
jgi:retinol dehydrogenase-12